MRYIEGVAILAVVGVLPCLHDTQTFAKPLGFQSGIYNLGAAGGSSFEISTTQRLLTGDLSYGVGVGVGVGVSVKVLAAAGTVCLTAELPST